MKKLLLISLATLTLSACVQEGSRTLPVQKVESAARPYAGVRVPVSVGKFDNRSSFMRGVFSNNEDRMGSQAQTILVTHLQQSQRFGVLDRSVMTEIKQEAALKKQSQNPQVAYAKVNLNIVNTLTSEVVYSSQGAGEYSLSEREVIGFGSTAGYDATLNGKVLDLAIRDAVNSLVSGIDSGAWRPAP
jgi:curli biogenesis system outer membrane secretion channel CsgG